MVLKNIFSKCTTIEVFLVTQVPVFSISKFGLTISINYNRVQKVWGKLHRLRKSCNHKQKLTDYIMRSCTTVASNKCRLLAS